MLHEPASVCKLRVICVVVEIVPATIRLRNVETGFDLQLLQEDVSR